MALLSLEGVGKRHRYGRNEVVVLDDVSLEVDPGEYVAVLAGRRKGKSTLLRLAAGIELADTGIVRFLGHDLAELSEMEQVRLWRDEVGFAPSPLDEWHESPRMRVAEFVRRPLLASRWKGRDAVCMARSTLERVGADDCAHRPLSELSLAELTRVAIARGLIRDPRLLLVDEPAATTSPGEQDEIRDLLRSLGCSNELTLVVASREPAVLRGAGRIMSLSNARVRGSDHAGEVIEFPRPQR